MKKRCCRSLPRCASCPVRMAAASRARQEADTPSALLAEILGGRPGRQLPLSVTAALAELELARAAR